MAQKIEGCLRHRIAEMLAEAGRQGSPGPLFTMQLQVNSSPDAEWQAVSVLIHDGPSEPVFTASEVKAMLLAIARGCVFYPGAPTTIAEISAKHGITL